MTPPAGASAPGPERPSERAAGYSLGAGILAIPVRLYQAARLGRPSPCRYWPSCSEYALDALREYGAARGGWMAMRRLGRCHPWGGHGVDPVPAPRAGWAAHQNGRGDGGGVRA